MADRLPPLPPDNRRRLAKWGRRAWPRRHRRRANQQMTALCGWLQDLAGKQAVASLLGDAPPEREGQAAEMMRLTRIIQQRARP